MLPEYLCPFAMGGLEKTVEIIISTACAIGAVEMSYVESRIISKAESVKLSENSFREIYWHNLSKKERWIYWTGFLLLVSSFVLIALL